MCKCILKISSGPLWAASSEESRLSFATFLFAKRLEMLVLAFCPQAQRNEGHMCEPRARCGTDTSTDCGPQLTKAPGCEKRSISFPLDCS